MNKPAFRTVCQYLGVSCRISIGSAMLIPAAQAADTWVGGAAGSPQDWNAPANWGGAFPAGTNAFVNTATAGLFPIISATPTSGTPVDLFVGNGAGVTGRLDHTAGTAGTGNGNWMWAGAAGGTGTFNLTGSGTFTAGTLNVGAWTSGTSTGTTLVNTSGSLNLTSTTNRNATLGAAALLVAEGGGNNSGTFELQNGTVNAAANTVIGYNTTGTGTFKMSGGVYNNTGEFVHGRSAPAIGNQSGGVLNSTSYFVIGRDNLGNGTYNLSGGTVNAATASGFTVMGSFSGGQGTLNVSGGSFNSPAGGMIIGEGGTGTLTVSGTGLVDIGAVNGYQLGANATGVGTINLNGGTMQGNRIYKNLGTGTFNFNGGTLKATAATANFFNLGATNARANVRDGGAVIDSNSFDVTIAQALLPSNVSGDLGTGGLTKTGAGKLTLSGANTYAGTTNVNGGTLEIALAGTLASNTVVASGGTLTGTGISTGSATFQAGSTLSTPVDGPLTVNGVSFTGATNLIFSGTPSNGSQYVLIKYGAGGVSGLANLSSTFRTNITNDAANSQVLGTVTTADITWNTTTGTWANGTGGWGGGSASYFNGDTVNFNERSGPSTITLSGVLLPASVAVNNSNNSYTFTGSGSISGATSLIKSGAGPLTIATANSYTGGTTLNAGTLNINNASALGNPVAPSNLMINGGTLNNTSGTAIVMSGNTPQIWSGDFTFTGSNNLDMGNGAVTIDGVDLDRTVTVSAGTLSVGEITSTFMGLIKQGAGTLEVSSTGANVAASHIAGPLNIAAGTLQINRSNADGNGSGDFTAPGLTGAGTLTNGAAVERWFFSNPGTGSSNFTGTVANGNAGGLGFNKSGDGTQILSGALSYTGQTTLENGTGELVISGNNSGAGTNVVLNTGKLTLGNTQSLGTASLIRLAGVDVSTLNLASDSDGTAYALTMGTGTSAAIVSNRATPGAGINHTLTTQALANGIGGGVINITSGANVNSGNGRITFTQFGMGAGSVQTTTLNPTTANVTLGTVSKQNNNVSQTLGLGGTSTDNHVTGVISNGPPLVAPNNVSVTKTDTSTWSLEGVNTYTGATTVSGGTLIITQPNLADAAVVNLNAPGVLNLPNAGTDTVDRVFIDGAEQAAGTWGSLTSTAAHKTARITGPGLLLATNGAAVGGFSGWSASFGLNPTGDGAPGVDKDQDGQDNGREYILGGSPVSGSNNPKIYALTADTNADTQKELVMTIAVPVGTPVFPAGTAGTPNSTVSFEGYTIEVRGSTTLSGYAVIVNPLATPVTTGLPAAPAQGGITYEYRSFSLSGSNGLPGKGFLQVRVTNPAS